MKRLPFRLPGGRQVNPSSGAVFDKIVWAVDMTPRIDHTERLARNGLFAQPALEDAASPNRRRRGCPGCALGRRRFGAASHARHDAAGDCGA